MADDPLNAPVMNPPPGEVQDLDNPPNKNDVVIAVYTVCLVIVSAFVGLRLYSKFVLLKMARTQDCKMISLFDDSVTQQMITKLTSLTDFLIPTYVRLIPTTPRLKRTNALRGAVRGYLSPTVRSG